MVDELTEKTSPILQKTWKSMAKGRRGDLGKKAEEGLPEQIKTLKDTAPLPEETPPKAPEQPAERFGRLTKDYKKPDWIKPDEVVETPPASEESKAETPLAEVKKKTLGS